LQYFLVRKDVSCPKARNDAFFIL
jgi:hypothetical protein